MGFMQKMDTLSVSMCSKAMYAHYVRWLAKHFNRFIPIRTKYMQYEDMCAMDAVYAVNSLFIYLK